MYLEFQIKVTSDRSNICHFLGHVLKPAFFNLIVQNVESVKHDVFLANIKVLSLQKS